MKIDTASISKDLEKLKRKNPMLFRAVQKKIKQISSYDETAFHHLKNLRHDLSDFKRVQIGSFILFFRLEGDKIVFERLKHHDDAYKS